MKNKLERLILRRGLWQAEILPGYAANTIRLRCGGEDVVRTPESDEEFLKDHIVYGICFLLPPDRTVGGRFTFGGETYTLPLNDAYKLSNLHGLMHDADFEVTEQTEERAVLYYSNRGERYPFHFNVTVTCRISETGYQVSYCFTNTGPGPMPLLFGLHANFKDQDWVKVPVAGEMMMDLRTKAPFPRVEALSEEGEALKAGEKSAEKKIQGFFTAQGHIAEIGDYRYCVSENFTHWVLWNGKGGEGFISVEPECGPVNGLQYDDGHIVLGKDQSIVFSTEIRRKNS